MSHKTSSQRGTRAWRPALAISLAALAVSPLLSACGEQGADTQASQARPAATPVVDPQVSAPPLSPTEPSPHSDLTAADQDEANRSRAASAPSGDPVPQTKRSGSVTGGEDFGEPTTVRGDVSVYPPVRKGDALAIPLKITNSGTKRAIYRVTIKVTGTNGFEATIPMETGTVGVYPGTSWPTELVATDAGKRIPKNPVVSIESSTRSEFGS